MCCLHNQDQSDSGVNAHRLCRQDDKECSYLKMGKGEEEEVPSGLHCVTTHVTIIVICLPAVLEKYQF